MIRFHPLLTRTVLLLVFTGLLLAGCSNPLSDDEGEATPGASDPVATATNAPPITIVTPTPVDPTAVAVATEAAPTQVRPETYIVAENDTLYGIAVKFGLDIATLVEVNGLSDPNDIWVGQELIIPPEQAQ